MEMKRRTLVLIIISIIFSVVLSFVLNLGIGFFVLGIVYAFFYTGLYFIIGKLDIRYADALFKISIFVCLGLGYFFSKTDICLKIDMLYWEREVIKENVLKKGIEYKLKDRRIYDSDDTVIAKYNYLKYIEEGNVMLLDNNNLTYTISFLDDKCAIKDSNKKIFIKSGSCIKE